ncbi:Phytanoyl-CoA dioxygenase [Candidatus Pelagibacterales bacterium]
MKSYIKEYATKGFFTVPNFFSSKITDEIKKAVKEISYHPDVKKYNDRSGALRRIEYFTFKNHLFKKINEQLKKLITDVTSKEQTLFKDKINFKPPFGEGFYAHYDGVFQFKTANGIIKNGWYEYAEDFNNVLLALDDFTHENGPLEIANASQGNFETLIKNTKGDGTPDIKEEFAREIIFIPMHVSKGSLVVFKHSCPHRSSPNRSSSERGSLYLTYNNLVDGDFYEQYFLDKHQSTNAHKSLLGEQS